jgi:2-polyprenyl-3-methyl-5-hydroxy-6-metoxy-1,4-benzoquinol methylase
VKPIEPAKLASTPGLVGKVADFWTRNVNAERIMGRSVSDHERGSERYFAELETQRYRSHRHLPDWIASMQSGSKVLEVGCGIGLDSARMAQHGLHVTAVDLTVVGPATSARRAQEQHYDASYLCSDAERLPFKDRVFDYVYSLGVMLHASDTQPSCTRHTTICRRGLLLAASWWQALIMLYHRHSLNEFAHRLLRVPFEERDKLCLVVWRYAVAEIQLMISRFAKVEVRPDFVFGEGYGALFRWTPLPLYRLPSRFLGWPLIIRATR